MYEREIKEAEESEQKKYSEGVRGLLEKFHQEKTGVFINGDGIGKITRIDTDYIDFEVIKEEEKTVKVKKKGKTENKKEAVLKREVFHIPINNILSISEGEKEIPKTEKEKQIDNALGDL